MMTNHNSSFHMFAFCIHHLSCSHVSVSIWSTTGHCLLTCLVVFIICFDWIFYLQTSDWTSSSVSRSSQLFLNLYCQGSLIIGLLLSCIWIIYCLWIWLRFFWLRSHTLWSNGMPLDLITSLHVLAGSMVRHFVGCVHLMVRSWHLLFHQCASGLLSNLKRCICTNDLLHHLYHTTIKFTYLFNCVTSIHQASIDCLCICSNSSYFFRASWVWGELGNQSNCNHVGII